MTTQSQQRSALTAAADLCRLDSDDDGLMAMHSATNGLFGEFATSIGVPTKGAQSVNHLIDSLDPFSATSIAAVANNSTASPRSPLPPTTKKAFSCSEYEEKLFSAEDLIRASTVSSKSRSHSEPEDESSLREPPIKPIFAPDFGPFAVPPPIRRKQRWQDNSPSPARYTDVPVTALTPNAAAATARPDSQSSFNGFIRHDSAGTHTDTENAGASSLLPQRTAGDSGGAFDDVNGNDTSSDDEVFSRYAKTKNRAGGGGDRKPLIRDSHSTGSGKKRVHFAKNKERVRMSLNDLDDDYGPKIRRGRSWRSRVSCVMYCVAANLLGVSLAFLVYYEIRGRGASSAVPSLPAVCPTVAVTYLGNRSTTDEGVGPLDGHSKLIKSSTGYLFLVPFGVDCSGCVNGIVAFRTNKMELAWVAQVDGKVEEFACAEDLNADGVWDCAISTIDPFSIELISGEDGSSIGRLIDPDDSRRIFLPQWIPDSNSDRIPELIGTVYDKRLKAVSFLLFASRRGGANSDDAAYAADDTAPTTYKTVDFVVQNTLLTITNASTQQEALLWKAGDSSKHSVVAVFDSKPGLYLWRKYDFFRKKHTTVRIIATNYRFDAPMGIFLDSDGDGDPELISCTKNGTVLSVNIHGDVRWLYHRNGSKCISNSLVGGRFLLESAPGVVVSFKGIASLAVQTILLDGETGRFERNVGSSTGAFDASPIVGRIFGDSSQDRLLQWNMNGKGEIAYGVTGYPWQDSSSIFRSDYVKANDFTTDKDELLRIHAFNQRFTGSVYEEKGKLISVFATNNKDASITAHKVQLTCDCAKEADHCGKFAEHQYWPSYRGARGDGYLL